jgi:hypothetical protein
MDYGFKEKKCAGTGKISECGYQEDQENWRGTLYSLSQANCRGNENQSGGFNSFYEGKRVEN